MHATILKGIVGDFKCTVFQRNLKESHGRPLIYVCECWRKVTKVGSTATIVRNSVLIISHITFRDCRVHFILDKLSRNNCMYTAQCSTNWVHVSAIIYRLIQVIILTKCVLTILRLIELVSAVWGFEDNKTHNWWPSARIMHTSAKQAVSRCG